MVWSPLGMGMLTGKYDEGVPNDSRFAREAQATAVSSVITGATRPEQVDENVGAAELELGAEVCAAIAEALS